LSAARLTLVDGVLAVAGDWRDAARVVWPVLPPGVGLNGTALQLDGAQLEAIAPNGAWLLLDGLAARGVTEPVPLNWPAKALTILQLVRQHRVADAPSPRYRPGALAQIGIGATATAVHLAGLVNFVGHAASELGQLARTPGAWRWRELGGQLQSIFVNAIPLALAMLFLLGVVFAYLLGTQAQLYGANIFVVDGVAMAVLRELSPVIVAILVAGRTGAAITAELGTMKVTEEIDAIATLGLSPFAVLVLPRLVALVIAMPLLVFAGDLAGLAGGALIQTTQLGLSPAMIGERLAEFLDLDMLLIGLQKAPVFALFIGLIACRMGLSVARDAQSVGRHTTSTVVQSIVAIIVLNACFAIAEVNG
jgi:phospholipid/cholesterol/gamma-HCH transport system permease protein